jgi:hypothetical protein
MVDISDNRSRGLTLAAAFRKMLAFISSDLKAPESLVVHILGCDFREQTDGVFQPFLDNVTECRDVEFILIGPNLPSKSRRRLTDRPVPIAHLTQINGIYDENVINFSRQPPHIICLFQVIGPRI